MTCKQAENYYIKLTLVAAEQEYPRPLTPKLASVSPMHLPASQFRMYKIRLEVNLAFPSPLFKWSSTLLNRIIFAK
jgi:hypothetical protein